MELVITKGQLTLVPIPGQEEGTRSGYLLNVQDIESGITVRISMGHAHAAQLGAVMVEDTTQNADGAPQQAVEVVPASALHALPDPPAAG